MAAVSRTLRVSIALLLCVIGVLFRFRLERDIVDGLETTQPVEKSAARTTAHDAFLANDVDKDNTATQTEGTSNTTTTTTAGATPPINIAFKKFKSLLFHIGKAGGTSTTKHLINDWHIQLSECHPTPCLKAAKAGKQGGRIALLNIRDPVDRFVSGFYFSIQRTCQPGQKRGCAHRPPHEIYITHTRYQKNASALAEDLCSANATAAQLAHESLRNITHLKHGIPEWLHYNYQPEKLFPLVLEPPFEFEAQMDTAMEWLYERLRYESPEQFAQRRLRVQRRSAARQGSGRHMSSARTKRALTAAAEACLEQYYRADYEMLQAFLEKGVCKTDVCRQAIQSILKRRHRALEGTAAATIPS